MLWRAALAALLLQPYAFDALAAQVLERSLDQKVQEATTVVVGIAEAGVGEVFLDGVNFRYVSFKVTRVLKGEPVTSINLMISGSVIDFNLNCCEVGKRYLLFLQEIKGGLHMSVNWEFGVYNLEE